jgi:hypothetical protein
MKTLFDKEILNTKLYTDIENVIKQEKKYNSTFLTSSLFGVCSYFANNKISIKLGNENPVSSSLMLVNIGGSGDGKSYSQTFVNNAFNNERKINGELNRINKDFASDCIKYLASDKYQIAKDNLENDGELKKEFATTYYYNRLAKDNLVDFNEWRFNTNPNRKPSYLIDNFTPESLPEHYNSNPRNALYIFGDEITNITENITRTNTVKNPFGFLINALMGLPNEVIRKTSDSVFCIGHTTIVGNCTPSSYMKFHTPELFGCGLGYRLFYMIDEKTNNDNNKYNVEYYKEGLNDVKEFESKVNVMIKSFIDIIDTYPNDIIYEITKPELIDLFNSKLQNIFSEMLNDSLTEKLNISVINELKNRIKDNFIKTILTLHVLNTCYDVKGFGVEYGDFKEITALSIERGAIAYKVFLQNTINVLTGKLTNELKINEKQKKILALIPIGEVMDKNTLFKLCEENNIVKRSVFYDYFNINKNADFCSLFEIDKFRNTVRRVE